MDKILKEKIIKALPKLKKWQQKVVLMRLGLIDGKSHSVEEVAKQFGYTETTIDNIMASALREAKDNPDSIEELGTDEVLGRMEYGRQIRVKNRERFLPRKEEKKDETEGER